MIEAIKIYASLALILVLSTMFVLVVLLLFQLVVSKVKTAYYNRLLKRRIKGYGNAFDIQYVEDETSVPQKNVKFGD